MDRNSIDWRGYIPAITTPFDSQGKLSLPMLEELLGWLLQERMHGIVVAGTTGEWFSIDDEEREQLFSTVGRVASGKLTTIAGCNSYTTTQAIDRANLASKYGFDGILLTAPPYVRPTPREIETFYRRVSDAIDLPICVYNWPPGTGIDMSLELLTRLADIENVVAIKNSTSCWDHFLAVFHALKDRVRIFGVPMNDAGIELVTQHGADGMMGAGAVLGRKQPEFFNALWRNDIAGAKAVAKLDRSLMEAWFTPELTGRFGSAQAILKAGLNARGLPGGFPRDPILPLDPADVEKVRESLEAIGVETIRAA